MNVHERVHKRLMNIMEQQLRLSWKFMSSWTYSVHVSFVFDHGLFMNSHKLRKFMNQG